ncbi:MAG TPA: GIY-YIG nuclease family protein, partial [Dehalococcoidia bacterium]|nr:GIY-YIG nuclease family protein [Dehalococcoidia bacterium]
MEIAEQWSLKAGRVPAHGEPFGGLRTGLSNHERSPFDKLRASGLVQQSPRRCVIVEPNGYTVSEEGSKTQARRPNVREKATMRTGDLARAKGSYVLVLHLAETKLLTVGKLGTFAFPTGFYLYFGSALNGLAGRIRRHLRQDKKMHWHVDALTAEAEVMEVAWVLGADRYECSWAKAAVEHAGATIPARG